VDIAHSFTETDSDLDLIQIVTLDNFRVLVSRIPIRQYGLLVRRGYLPPKCTSVGNNSRYNAYYML